METISIRPKAQSPEHRLCIRNAEADVSMCGLDDNRADEDAGSKPSAGASWTRLAENDEIILGRRCPSTLISTPCNPRKGAATNANVAQVTWGFSLIPLA